MKDSLVSLIYQSRVGPSDRSKIYTVVKDVWWLSLRAYWSTLVDWFYTFHDLSMQISGNETVALNNNK